MNKVLFLFLLITTTAFGQIDDCEKTLVFDKTYDFNETNRKYFFKNPVKRIMAEHELRITNYLSISEGTFIETFEPTFGDDESYSLNSKISFITTLDLHGNQVYHFSGSGYFGHLPDFEISDATEITDILLVGLDTNPISNEYKFYKDVETKIKSYLKSKERQDAIGQLANKCEDPIKLYSCLYGLPSKSIEVTKCDD